MDKGPYSPCEGQEEPGERGGVREGLGFRGQPATWDGRCRSGCWWMSRFPHKALLGRGQARVILDAGQRGVGVRVKRVFPPPPCKLKNLISSAENRPVRPHPSGTAASSPPSPASRPGQHRTLPLLGGVADQEGGADLMARLRLCWSLRQRGNLVMGCLGALQTAWLDSLMGG